MFSSSSSRHETRIYSKDKKERKQGIYILLLISFQNLFRIKAKNTEFHPNIRSLIHERNALSKKRGGGGGEKGKGKGKIHLSERISEFVLDEGSSCNPISTLK